MTTSTPPDYAQFIGTQQPPKHFSKDQRIAYRGIIESVKGAVSGRDYELVFGSKGLPEQVMNATRNIAYIDALSEEQLTAIGFARRTKIPLIGLTEDKIGRPPESLKDYGAGLRMVIVDRTKSEWTSTLMMQITNVLDILDQEEEEEEEEEELYR